MTIGRSVYMNTEEVAVYLRFVDLDGVPDLKATREFLKRKNVPMKRRGRAVLAHRDAVEAALEPIRRTA